jgi:hypothetical protein
MRTMANLVYIYVVRPLGREMYTRENNKVGSLGMMENWSSLVQKIVHSEFQTVLHDPTKRSVVMKKRIVN